MLAAALAMASSHGTVVARLGSRSCPQPRASRRRSPYGPGEAAELARKTGGFYIDQFTFAERATDWRGGLRGASVYAALRLAEEMAPAGETGSIVAILCDSSNRYASTLYSNA